MPSEKWPHNSNLATRDCDKEAVNATLRKDLNLWPFISSPKLENQCFPTNTFSHSAVESPYPHFSSIFCNDNNGGNVDSSAPVYVGSISDSPYLFGEKIYLTHAWAVTL